MTPKSIKLQAVHSVILMLKELQPPGELLSNWKEHTKKIARISLDSQPASGSAEEPGKIADHTAVLKDLKAHTVRKQVKDLDVPLKKSVLMTDEPRVIRNALKLGMAMHIGIAGQNQSFKKFYDAGADLVLDDLEKIDIAAARGEKTLFIQSLPSVFSRLDKFHLLFELKTPVYFFDYDGTLSPIVRDPSRAVISERMRELLRQLSRKAPVAIVSGRDMDDIKGFIGLDSLIYAGSHGFRISGPEGLRLEHDNVSRLLPQLDTIEQELKVTLENRIEGVEVERKRYAVAVHYRNTPPARREAIRRTVRMMARKNKNLKTGAGKMLIEIKPTVDWHKGRAIEWILDNLDLPESTAKKVLPMYIGDDITDEDAFRAIADNGIGILVGTHARPSAAHYHLEDVSQVEKFIHYLVQSE